MKRAWLGLLVAGLLAGCNTPQSGQVVQVPPYKPGSVASPLSRVGRAIVAVAPFAELGAQAPAAPGGTVFAGSPKLEVFVVQPSPGRLLTDAIAAELGAAGHQLGGPGAPVAISGGVQRFEAKASKTALYWAVDVQVAAAVTAERGGRKLSHSYVAHCQDVAYTAPDATMMAPTVARCVADIAHQFRDDAAMAGVIGG